MMPRSRMKSICAVAALASGLVLAGCGDVETRDLCSQYDDVVTQAQELNKLDAATATADEVRKQVEALRVQVDQFQAVAEGQLDQAISRLRAALTDAREDAAAAANQAADQVRAVLKDDLQNIRNQWALIKQAVDVQCATQ